ncbi:hydroxyacid dehydrogenase [Patescibacteria group bacterium]|nr:hydroxyacid dehydrogenase [Patescibacteria group bacterium]MCL5409752.1 hydroxyacid dehydrogenase [Patescibacteria group bacterium]
MKIGFFETQQWEAKYLSQKLVDFSLNFSQSPLDNDQLRLVSDYDAISVFTGSKITAEIMDSLPNLKLITTRTTGLDHIDLKAAQKRKIVISYVPGYGDNTVAEYAFGLLLNLSRKIYQAYEEVKGHGSFDSGNLQGFDLLGKTLGVVGTGRIGQYSIKIAQGFGMKVIAYDAYPKPSLQEELNFQYVDFEELLKNSDVITLHVPYLPSTHHMINKHNVEMIKKGAVLINTSRGAVIETEVLIQALQAGILSGAGLDVLEEEGGMKDQEDYLLTEHPKKEELRTMLENQYLIDHENVIITPHNAFNTQEAVKRILDTTIENIISFSKGKPSNTPAA